MRRDLIIGFACLFLAAPALGDAVKVSKTDCSKLVKHQAAANVEYKPGVDVHGRKVAPADLDGGVQLKLPEEITIDIGMDLVKKYGISGASPNLYTAEATKMGVVTVKNGKATFNGQSLTSSEQDALAEACKQKGVK
jgi:hypothetical protein